MDVLDLEVGLGNLTLYSKKGNWGMRINSVVPFCS